MRKLFLAAGSAAALLAVTAMADTASAKGTGGTGWTGSSPPGLAKQNKTPPGFVHARKSEGWMRHNCRIKGQLSPPGWCR
jgi:hypothetical protein